MFGHAQKAKFLGGSGGGKGGGVKSDTAVLLLLLAFSPTSLFAFLASFFSFAGHLVGFIFVGKAFRKAFVGSWIMRILGLDKRTCWWVVEQDFHGNFRVYVAWFFAFFSVLG